MADDGTISGGADALEITARNIVDLYFKNVNTTARTRDVYKVGNAILGRIDEVAEEGVETATSLSELEVVTEKEFKTVEQRLTEIEVILAQTIFVLEDTGLDITNDMQDFMNENLNI